MTSRGSVKKEERGKEKQLVLKNRPADPVTILIQTLLLPGHSIFVIEKVVCVQGVVAEVFPHAAVIGAAAAPRCHFDLHGALPGFRSAVGSRGVAELLDRVNSSPPSGAEPI